MRRVAEAAHRVPEVQDINIVETPRGLPNISITNQWSEGRDLIPESSQPIEEILPSTVEQQPSVREDTIREREVVIKHVPLLNGGPPTSREGSRTTMVSTVATTTVTTTTETIPMESVSLSSTPQISSTGMEEGIPLSIPICLTEEDPQITCSICNITDCMIHNPRHYYCMDCGQRLMGPHGCPNEIEHLDPSRTQNPDMTSRTQPIEPENGGTHLPEVLLPPPDDLNMETFREMVLNSAHMLNMDSVTRPVPPSSAPFETSYTNLPTYEEAITSDQGMTARTRVTLGIQNVLHHINYSSDPEEARIHFELTSPLRHVRSQDRYASPQRCRRKNSPEHHGASHYHYYHRDVNVRQPPWTAEHTILYRAHTRQRQIPGGDDGSSPGDEGDSTSGRSSGG